MLLNFARTILPISLIFYLFKYLKRPWITRTEDKDIEAHSASLAALSKMSHISASFFNTLLVHMKRRSPTLLPTMSATASECDCFGVLWYKDNAPQNITPIINQLPVFMYVFFTLVLVAFIRFTFHNMRVIIHVVSLQHLHFQEFQASQVV